MPTWELPRKVVASHGDAWALPSLLRSKARGRNAPDQSLQPVGGCAWYIWVTGPKNPSLPNSRSKVPGGRFVWAWREATPSRRGNEIQRFMAALLSWLAGCADPRQPSDKQGASLRRGSGPSTSVPALLVIAPGMAA